MHWLADRFSRLRWMAVPIAAYLAVTLLLPLANGAALRGNFLPHTAWVLAGCLVILGAVLLGGLAVELVRGGVARLRHHLGGPS